MGLCDWGKVILLIVTAVLSVIAAIGFLAIIFYLGCTGALSPLWPALLNLLFCGLLNPLSSKLGKIFTNTVSKAKKWMSVALILVVMFVILTLGILNIINLTFSLFIVVNVAITAILTFLKASFGEVENLYQRVMYASGFVATVTFAFLIAFEVVPLATVAYFAAPSIAFAFLCFVYCLRQRFEMKYGCFCMNFCATQTRSDNNKEIKNRATEKKPREEVGDGKKKLVKSESH